MYKHRPGIGVTAPAFFCIVLQLNPNRCSGYYTVMCIHGSNTQYVKLKIIKHTHSFPCAEQFWIVFIKCGGLNIKNTSFWIVLETLVVLYDRVALSLNIENIFQLSEASLII